MKILVVDDNQEELHLLETILKRSGYEIKSALNGEEALKKLHSEKFDMIISDILMPIMDGFHLCREVRKNKNLRDIPFIFYTATYLNDKDEELGLKMGADKYIRKPIEPDEFLKIIRDVFEQIKRERPREFVFEEKQEVLRLYNERLVKKLEDKVLELKRLGERYQRLCENINDFIFSLNEEGYFTEANRRSEMFGYKPEEVIGKHFTQFLTEGSQKVALDYFRRAKRGESHHDLYEVQVIRKDGRIADVEVSVSTLYQDGKFIGRFGVLRDITPRKQMERKIYELLRFQESIVENANIWLDVLDREGNIIIWNKAAGEISGYSKNEVIGHKKIWEWLYPEEEYRSKIFEKAISIIEKGERVEDFETKIRCKDGREKIISWHSRNIIDEKGKTIGSIALGHDITEHKRAEQALIESEDKFRKLAESSPIGIYIIYENLFRYVNQAFLSISGYEEDEIIDCLGPLDLVHPEDRAQVEEVLRKDISGDIEEAHLEIRGIRKDGAINYCEIHGRRIEYKDGIGIIGTLIDITERKQAEEKLRESEKRYRTIIEQATDGIFIHDEKGYLVDINLKACESLGYSKEELISKHIGEIDPEAIKAGKHHLWEKVFEGEHFTFESYHKRKDGSFFPVEVTLGSLNLPEGKAIIGIARDISERKRVEEALRLSEERFRQFFENAPVYCYMVSVDGNILDINRAALDCLRYKKDELIGRSVITIYSPEYHSKALENLEKWSETGRLENVEMEILTKKGERRLVVLSADAIRNRDGKILYSISIQRDITERRSLEEQLRQAQRMEAIGRLAGGVAHDFNNLLTVIKGNSQLALMDLREGDPLKKNVEEIQLASERAADLTRQLLAFSRRQIMEMKVLDLNVIIKNLERMLRRIIGEDIELVTFLQEEIGRVKADPGQIEQVITNIVVNARDAMPEGGKLTIETANVELDEAYAKRHIAVEPGRYVMLSISDTGVGMSQEVKERAFEPFFTTKEMGKGTGLGLSTVYGIVKQSGGNIWVYSEPGKGTTFKIYLPRVEEPLEELKEKVFGEELPRGSETALVIEDDETVRKLAIRILRKQGYKVLEASDGGKAFMLCEEYKEPIHLILSDVVMPGMSGRKLVERLKQIHPESKALYMSGYTDNVILQHGILEGGLDFIQKPFTLEGLARKVREVLDK